MAHTVTDKVKLAVTSDIHLLPEAEKAIRNLTGSDVIFPSEDSQPPFAELVNRTGSAEMVLTSPGTKLPREFFEQCPSVKYVGICGTLMESLDQEAARSRRITLTNVVELR